MGNYCTKDLIARQTFQADAIDETQLEVLIPAASRLIDRLCEVDDDYFAAAAAAASDRTFYGSGTRYLYVGPHNTAAASILAADVEFVDTSLTVPIFRDKDNYLIAELGYCWDYDEALTISAKWGFAAIPAEIEQACIELVIAIYRTGDGSRERAIADASDVEQRLAKIPARVRQICQDWQRKQPVVFA